MKLKKKLAEEFIRKVRIIPPFTEIEKESFMMVYVAGFEKAREMAEHIEWNAAGNSEQLHKLKCLGEEEVPDESRT